MLESYIEVKECVIKKGTAASYIQSQLPENLGYNIILMEQFSTTFTGFGIAISGVSRQGCITIASQAFGNFDTDFDSVKIGPYHENDWSTAGQQQVKFTKIPVSLTDIMDACDKVKGEITITLLYKMTAKKR